MEHLLGWDGLRFELVGVAVAAGLRPEAAAEHAELLAALRTAVVEVLTPHQREVLLTWAATTASPSWTATPRGTDRPPLVERSRT